MDNVLKTLFILAVIIFCLLVIASFLLLIKILLIFFPEINVFGIRMTY